MVQQPQQQKLEEAEEKQKLCPFKTQVLADPLDPHDDAWPASFSDYATESTRDKPALVLSPADHVNEFLKVDLAIQRLDAMRDYFWLAGEKRQPSALHFQIAVGRQIVVADRMDLHLIHDSEGKLFLKPIPRYLLYPAVWREAMQCPADCPCLTRRAAAELTPDDSHMPPTCMRHRRTIARGFLYTYTALLASEVDWSLANERRLLPRTSGISSDGVPVPDIPISWSAWKKLVRELLASHDSSEIHPRFLYAEFRLSRLNLIHRFAGRKPLTPYRRSWRNYGSLFSYHIKWMGTATVFLALVLTAMQVGLATERLQGSEAFQRASYGFTVFSILGPMGAIVLVVLIALFDLVRNWQSRRKNRSVEKGVPVPAI